MIASIHEIPLFCHFTFCLFILNVLLLLCGKIFMIFMNWQRALLNVQRKKKESLFSIESVGHWLFSVVWSRWQQDSYLPPDYKDKKGPVWTTCYAKPIWLEGGWKTPSISMWMWTAFIYPSVIDLVKPDPLDFFPSPKENSTSPVTGEIFNFTRPVCGLSDATLHSQRISF